MTLEQGSIVPQSAVDSGRNLIGLPNFGRYDGLPLSHAEDDIRTEFSGRTNVVVIPHASANMDKQSDNAMKAFKRIIPDLGMRSLHKVPESDVLSVLEQADGIYIAGGVTYDLSVEGARNANGTPVDPREGAVRQPIFNTLRQKVAESVPTSGASAGLLVMAQSIEGALDPTSPVRTLESGERVVSVQGLGVLPDHLHPVVHYIDFDEEYNAEELKEMFIAFPKLERTFDHLHSWPANIRSLLQHDPQKVILALRDNSYILVKGMNMELRGEQGGVIFEADKLNQVVEPVADLSHLLLPR